MKLIQPTLNKNETRLKNSQTFVEKSKEWIIDPTEVQVSFDVVNLYPSVPIKVAIDVITQILATDSELKKRTKLTIADMRKLIDLCLSTCYFLWEDKIYKLQNSGPIGLALMVVVAEAFLQYHERNAINKALSNTPSVAPKSFLRFVDDSHARFDDLEKASLFHDILNQQNEHINYTIEIEDLEKSLKYMDLNIQNKNGKYDFQVHRKNAITNVQLAPHSGHDPKILRGVFTGFLHRAYSVCEGNHLHDEIEFLIKCFIDNGYDERELRDIEHSYRQKRVTAEHPHQQNQQEQHNDKPLKTVTLPWIPVLSPKL